MKNRGTRRNHSLHDAEHHPESMKMIELLRDTLYFLKSPCIPLEKGESLPF
jgi:hypothetical protein